jgi:hypothetical protein
MYFPNQVSHDIRLCTNRVHIHSLIPSRALPVSTMCFYNWIHNWLDYVIICGQSAHTGPSRRG